MKQPPVFGVAQSITGQAWHWRNGHSLALGEAARLGMDDLVAGLFRARGAEACDIERLRTPTMRDWLPDPAVFSDMEKAAARLADAVMAGEAITIFGDYDVDGATSAAVLVRFLRAAGAVVGTYIPDRLLEGYGPSADALVALKTAGAQLVVTVDCGTQGFEALEAARAAGLDVIVVDHHKASTALPVACAIVNPNRLDESAEAASYGHVAAVGMAFLLAVATNRLLRQRGHFSDARPEPRLMEYLDLVALGTVADVVPLRGLNRAFVAQGLKVMAQRRNVGLVALSQVARMNRAPRASDLGFLLGPRINAGGRVGRSDLGVRLLTTEDAGEAQALADELDLLNSERRAIEAQVSQEAEQLAGRTANMAVTVVAQNNWHPGVIGIVAGRLKEKLGRPAIVIALDEQGMGKGSGRSVVGVDLGAAILAAKDCGLLVAGGGHAMAAGLTIEAAQLDNFISFLHARLEKQVAEAQAQALLELDCAVAPRGLNLDLCAALETAGPYGAGWPAPRVAAGPFAVIKADVVGEAHIRLILQGRDGGRLKAMAFRARDTILGAHLAQAKGRQLYVAGRVQRDDWASTPAAEMHIDDAAWAD